MRIYYGRTGTDTDPDTAAGGIVLEKDMRESLNTRDVIIYSGHSGPFYGFALANWKKTDEGDLDHPPPLRLRQRRLTAGQQGRGRSDPYEIKVRATDNGNQIPKQQSLFTDQIIQIFIPQYFAAKPYILALSSIILPYVLLQLLIFNLFKIQNSSRIFFYNSLIHLLLLIAALFISVMLLLKLAIVPFVILAIFFSWYLSSEYLLLMGNSVFKKGIKYRSLSVICTILVNILYATFS